jgi:hypothetical protein
MLLGKGLSSSGGRRCRGRAKAFATRFEILRHEWTRKLPYQGVALADAEVADRARHRGAEAGCRRSPARAPNGPSGSRRLRSSGPSWTTALANDRSRLASSSSRCEPAAPQFRAPGASGHRRDRPDHRASTRLRRRAASVALCPVGASRRRARHGARGDRGGWRGCGRRGAAGSMSPKVRT